MQKKQQHVDSVCTMIDVSPTAISLKKDVSLRHCAVERRIVQQDYSIEISENATKQERFAAIQARVDALHLADETNAVVSYNEKLAQYIVSYHVNQSLKTVIIHPVFLNIPIADLIEAKYFWEVDISPTATIQELITRLQAIVDNISLPASSNATVLYRQQQFVVTYKENGVTGEVLIYPEFELPDVTKVITQALNVMSIDIPNPSTGYNEQARAVIQSVIDGLHLPKEIQARVDYDVYLCKYKIEFNIDGYVMEMPISTKKNIVTASEVVNQPICITEDLFDSVGTNFSPVQVENSFQFVDYDVERSDFTAVQEAIVRFRDEAGNECEEIVEVIFESVL